MDIELAETDNNGSLHSLKTDIAAKFYNASGIQEDNLPFTTRSELLLDRIRHECEAVIFKGAKTLEIGCGNGRYSFAFEKMGAIPTGIDCASELITFAKHFAEQTLSKARFVFGDALNMEFDEHEFDVIFLVGNNIIEFSLPDIDLICRQIGDILKADGVFCISMNDCALHQNGKTLDHYDAESGLLTSQYEIPEKGSFEYNSYFWTVSMAKFICSKYFDDIMVKRLEDNRYWLECRDHV
jgi:2-polyprenyl-3-methyl-5-hydroxy-6-metoxy-1,4-benzoquinol methylase